VRKRFPYGPGHYTKRWFGSTSKKGSTLPSFGSKTITGLMLQTEQMVTSLTRFSVPTYAGTAEDSSSDSVKKGPHNMQSLLQLFGDGVTNTFAALNLPKGHNLVVRVGGLFVDYEYSPDGQTIVLAETPEKNAMIDFFAANLPIAKPGPRAAEGPIQ
jgi:hypothetical protein